jgi:hypothetical protein
MKSFMPELEPKLRLQALKDNCDSAEETEYYRDLTQDDLDVKREKLSTNLVYISEREDELQVIKDEFKSKTQGPKQENKQLLEEIKTRKAKVSGVLYHMADHVQGIMETFDENGEFISSRRLRPDEKQPGLFAVKPAVNQ